MLSVPFKPAMCRCGSKPAQGFAELSAWIVHLPVTLALGEIQEIQEIRQ